MALFAMLGLNQNYAGMDEKVHPRMRGEYLDADP